MTDWPMREGIFPKLLLDAIGPWGPDDPANRVRDAYLERTTAWFIEFNKAREEWEKGYYEAHPWPIRRDDDTPGSHDTQAPGCLD